MKITRQQFLKYFSFGLASTALLKKPVLAEAKMAQAREEVRKMKLRKSTSGF